MKEITEDYVSLETAKLLKEKGFDEKCFQYWHEKDNELVHSRSPHPIRNITNPCFLGPAAPTLQMVMKWLREMYDIHVVPRKDFFNGTYTGMIYDGRRENVFDKDDYIALVGYETYEQACEAGIKFCLTHLI